MKGYALNDVLTLERGVTRRSQSPHTSDGSEDPVIWPSTRACGNETAEQYKLGYSVTARDRDGRAIDCFPIWTGSGLEGLHAAASQHTVVPDRPAGY